MRDEIIRLQKENAELREKLNLAIEIVNDFIETGRKPDSLVNSRLDRKSLDIQKNIKAVI